MDEIFTIGKYKGRLFSDVRAREPGYVSWARREKNVSGQLQRFVEYCAGSSGGAAAGSSPQHAAPRQPPLPGGQPAGVAAPAWPRSVPPTDGSSPITAPRPAYPKAPRPAFPAGSALTSAAADPARPRTTQPALRVGSSPTATVHNSPASVGAAAQWPKRPASFETPPKRQRVSFGGGKVAAGADVDEALCEICQEAELPFPGAARCRICYLDNLRTTGKNLYLRCRFEDKDEAKRRGARWDPEARKWYVPAGKDISQLERWVVQCKLCGEDLSNHPTLSDERCVPECAHAIAQREHEERRRKDAEALEELCRLESSAARTCETCGEDLSGRLPLACACTKKDRKLEEQRKKDAEQEAALKQKKEAAEQRRKKLLKSVKSEFREFLMEQARIVHKALKLKNEQLLEAEKEGTAPSHVPVILPKCLVTHVGQSLKALSEGKTNAAYNPFTRDDQDCRELSDDVTKWLRSFGSEGFKASEFHDEFFRQVDFRPTRLLDWGSTFYTFFADSWIEAGMAKRDPRFYVRSAQELLGLLLQQAQDSVTPDLVILIRERLAEDYGAICPDIVAIIGSKILPRIRATLGTKEFAALGREERAKWCVLEYMKHRRKYDSEVGETEETMLMRDTLNVMIEDLLKNNIVSRDISADGNDAILYATSPTGSDAPFFLLRHPNTAAADLFSVDIVKQACESMPGKPVPAPTPAQLRSRVFALFRALHFRVTRKVNGLGYAAYGLDEGLRKTDKVFLKLQHEEPELHEEMLERSWKVRDFLGWQAKKLHSNSQLPVVLFDEHLGLPKGKVAKMRGAAEKKVARLRKEAEAKNKSLLKQLEDANVNVLPLVDL